MPPRSYASQGGRIGIRRSNRDQENLPLMRFSSIIYGRQKAQRWDATDSLYVKGQGYQWNPDDKGGGPGQPVLGDTYVEATITAETEHAFTLKVHFKVTHFGTDQHSNALQEFLAVYANLAYSRFARYGGTRPWTNDTVSFTTMPLLPNGSPLPYAPEQWAAFVDNSDMGLAVFIPGVAPYIGGFAAAGDPGPTGFGTNYFNAFTIYSFGPNSVLEGDVYLVAGDYKHSRQVIYDLHNRLPAVDIFTPFGVVDTPPPNSRSQFNRMDLRQRGCFQGGCVSRREAGWYCHLWRIAPGCSPRFPERARRNWLQLLSGHTAIHQRRAHDRSQNPR